MSNFPIKLKKLRISRGMTQKELADSLNVSQNAIYNWENGKREPRLEQIVKIANAFPVPVDYFLSDFENTLKQENWKTTEDEREEIKKEKDLLRCYHELGTKGKDEAVKRIRELLYIPDYQKDTPED